MAKARKTKSKGTSSKRKTRPTAPASDELEGRKAILMVAEKDLNQLVDRCIRRREEVSTSSGEIGKLVADAVEKKGLHRGAYGQIERLVRMGRKDPGKLWLYLAHFDDMRTKAGLDELAGDQSQMFDAGTEADDAQGDLERTPRAGPRLATQDGDFAEAAE